MMDQGNSTGSPIAEKVTPASEDGASFTINGHQIVLSEGRKVWAGKHDDSWYIQFDDGQGNLSKLRISYSATDALVKLLTTPTEEIYRYLLTVDPSGERPMKWEVFEPALVGALASGEASEVSDDR